MSYTPVFTSEVKVEGLTQLTISASSVPTTAQLLVWIEEAEEDLINRNLYTQTATDEYIDVPPMGSGAGSLQVSYDVSSETLRFASLSGTLIPLTNSKKPIISVTSLAKNDEAYEDAASWDTLTEGPADDSSFLLLRTGPRALGYALWVYDNFPEAGPKRLKMTYTYGYNLDTDILSRHSTIACCIKVLQARRGTSSPDGLSELAGGVLGTFVPTQYATRIENFEAEIKQIERDHFPPKELAAAVLS